MSSRHAGALFALLRQGLTLGVDYGTHSLEALLAVAETVEENVYAIDSFRRTGEGIEFALDNPPLRVGAFGAIRLAVDGTFVPPERVRWRAGEGREWRTADSVGPATPLWWAPGDRTEFAVLGTFGVDGRPSTVRLELRSTAIPPLVWFEFTETLEEKAPPP